jgi:hypothetical protein
LSSGHHLCGGQAAKYGRTEWDSTALDTSTRTKERKLDRIGHRGVSPCPRLDRPRTRKSLRCW